MSSGSSIDGARFVPGAMLAGRYRIVGLLGRGGMGEVYRADDLKLSQSVALKFLPDTLASDGAALARFHREVRIARQVSHPNVCRVFDIGEVDSQHFLSMEYIDGEELGSLLRRIGRLPPDKATEIARQICAGLAAAHDNGVLHRDLKPSNIMVDGRGKARITDFGLAALAGDLRGDELYAGTPAYMAPELLAGKQVTVKSDIYSLGLVLYEIFTGRRAFEATTVAEFVRLQTGTAPTKPSSLVKDIDPRVERVILRCLEKDPERRPASAMHVAVALPGGDPLQAALAAGETPSPEMVAAAPKEGSLRPAVAITCLGSILAGLILVVMLSDKVRWNRLVPLEKPPEALADRASTITNKLGYNDPLTDSAYGFTTNRRYLRYVEEHDASPARWDKLATGQPAALTFWYRRSPRYLMTITQDGRVSLTDPPPLVSGMVSVVLDTRGRLIEFNAVPVQFDDEPEESPAPDWGALFNEAGLDLKSFKPSHPKWVPTVYSDSRAAWEGVFPDQPQIPLRVEAGAYRGKPVYFDLLGPWDKPDQAQPIQSSGQWRAPDILLFVLFMAVLLGGALLALRNLRLGRGDRQGAFRLAMFMVLALTLSWVFRASHVPNTQEVDLFFKDVGGTLCISGLFWLLYMALEPYVRRRWPHRIISWSRLLAGGFRDPLVGRDILIGGLFGITMALTNYFWSLVPKWLGWPPGPLGGILHELLLGMDLIVSWFIRLLLVVTFVGLGYLFVLLLLQIILRKEWIAIGVSWLLLTLIFGLAGTNPLRNLFFAGLIVAMTVLVFTRFGLLAGIASQLFFVLMNSYPITSDSSAWYFGSALFALFAVTSLATYGFYTALAGQPLFRDGLLRD